MRNIICCGLGLSLLLAATTASAIPIDSSLLVRADYDLTAATPSAPYGRIFLRIILDASDQFDPGETLTVDYHDGLGSVLTAPFTFSVGAPRTELNLSLGSGNYIRNPGAIGTVFLSLSGSGSFDLLAVQVSGVSITQSGGEGVGFTFFTPGTFVVEPIPEPSTALLVGLGLVGLGAKRRTS